jgi:UDP-N-acetylglucosamine 2-epimerase (non-hydrolysing)
MKNIDASKVFQRHPELHGGDFVRFCIHRRENCMSDKRFLAIYGAMKTLIEKGRTVLLISMFQTEKAFERLGLMPEVKELEKKFKNFVHSPVWPEYGDVMAAMSRSAVCATDSGSMQEEMNAMDIPCVTMRFGSDRSESAIAGGNLIAPPVDSDLIVRLIEHAWDNTEMRRAPLLYGTDVSKKSVDVVETILAKGEVFRTDDERLKL